MLQANNICKSFNDVPALTDINFTLESGTILCLLGPSGCGKTTLLRIIAGLETPDKGTICFNGADMEKIAPYKREFRMMFQEFALFPHKNIFQNIAFGLNIQKLSEKQVNHRVNEMLCLVGLEEFEKRNVSQLSGGERQRVALARSLAPHPRLLMLDEPLGALDRQLRKRLIFDLHKILRRVKVPTILVTHDQSEGFAIADKIAVMHNSRIEQIDSPEILYRKPANQIVARFLGFTNLINGIIRDNKTIETSVARFYVNTKNQTGKSAVILLRPECAKLLHDNINISDKQTIISGKVKDRLFQGAYYHINIELNSGRILFFDLPNEPQPPYPGEKIDLIIDESGVVVME